MEIDITRQENETVVRLSGRLDTPAAQEITPQMNELSGDAGGTVVLECSDLTYISSSGLRIFLTLRKAAAENDDQDREAPEPVAECRKGIDNKHMIAPFS